MRIKTMSYREYKRRVFNEAVIECMCGLHNMIISEGADGKEFCSRKTCAEMHSDYDAGMAAKMARAFFVNELGLENGTIAQTKGKLLNGCNSFMKDVCEICEAVAEDKANVAEEKKLELPEDLTVQLSEEDQALMDKLFDEKSPEAELSAVRDATVQALVAENKKAEEIKAAVDMAKADAAENGSKKLEETVNRISAKGPTSLANAIITRMSSEAIKEVFNESGTKSVSEIMADNQEKIRNRAMMVYTLYEMANVFGIHKYTSKEVRDIAYEIYYNK